MSEIADQVGAYLMVDVAHALQDWLPLVSIKPHPYADVVTTTTHKRPWGPRGGGACVLANKESA